MMMVCLMVLMLDVISKKKKIKLAEKTMMVRNSASIHPTIYLNSPWEVMMLMVEI